MDNQTKAAPTKEELEAMELLADPYWRLQNMHHIKSEETGQIQPFTPYPEQMQVFDAVLLEGHKRIIIPKARRRGMSTGIDILMADQAIMNAGFEAGIVDRNQSEASKKLSNTIKTSIDKLPEFLLEDIQFGKNNDDHLSFKVGKDAESHIYASTGYRGGNCNFLHVSEWGWIQCADPKRSEEIQTGAIQAARRGQIVVETTWKGGKRGHLWEYTKQALETPEDEKHERSWRVLFFPWHTDPLYSIDTGSKIRSEVYEYFEELAGLHGIVCTEAQMRWYQEEAWPLNNNRFGEYPSTLEECFKSPMDGVIYESEMARALAERRITSIPVEKGLPVFVSFDLGRNDAMPMVFIQPVGKELRIIDYYVNHRESIKHYGDVVKTWMADKGVWDCRILLPHDGNRKSLETGKTLVEAFREMGFNNVQHVSKIPNTWTGINYVRDTFPYLWFDAKVMAKKFTRGGKEFPSLGECLSNYHQAEDKNGMMVSMEPVHDDYSHGCFVAGTMVDTPTGPRRIETLRVGDLVDTPAGASRILGAGMTNPHAAVTQLKFSDGATVVCTPDHPFLTDQGLTRADELSTFTVPWTKHHHKKSGFKGQFTNYRDDTMLPHQVRERNIATCTGQYGLPTMGQSLMGGMFTTRMATGSIMMWKILRHYLQPSTSHAMEKTLIGCCLVEQKNASWKKPFQPARRGIHPPKGWHGMRHTVKHHGQSENQWKKTVRFVARNLRQRPTTNNFADGFASSGSTMAFLLSRFSKIVHTVGRALRTTPRAKSKSIAPRLVSGERVVERQPVFNIEVEDHHCFYANGFLVSNCDAIRTFCEGWQRGQISRVVSRGGPEFGDEMEHQTNALLAGGAKWRRSK